MYIRLSSIEIHLLLFSKSLVLLNFCYLCVYGKHAFMCVWVLGHRCQSLISWRFGAASQEKFCCCAKYFRVADWQALLEFSGFSFLSCSSTTGTTNTSGSFMGSGDLNSHHHTCPERLLLDETSLQALKSLSLLRWGLLFNFFFFKSNLFLSPQLSALLEYLVYVTNTDWTPTS